MRVADSGHPLASGVQPQKLFRLKYEATNGQYHAQAYELEL